MHTAYKTINICRYNGKKYVIVRFKNDNEKDVQEMLQFYHLV